MLGTEQFLARFYHIQETRTFKAHGVLGAKAPSSCVNLESPCVVPTSTLMTWVLCIPGGLPSLGIVACSLHSS